MPAEPLRRYRLLHKAIQAGLVAACHDLSEGGLAVALAEMALAGRLGAQIEIAPLRKQGAETTPVIDVLFSESNGRLLIEVAPGDAQAIETIFAGEPLVQIGAVTGTPHLIIADAQAILVDLTLEQLVAAWTRSA